MSEKSDALKFAWWIENDKVALVYADTTNVNDSYSSPSVVKTVTVRGYFNADKFVEADSGGTNETGVTEECSLPEEFHTTIISKAVQKGYELKPETIQSAQYFENQYERGVQKAKRKANTGGLTRAVVRLQDL